MRDNTVFDAGVLALNMAGDARIRPYLQAMDRGETKAYVAAVNLSEFYYKTCRIHGAQVADAQYYNLLDTQLNVVGGWEIAREAGLEMCRRHLDLSLADCYALALARRLRAELLTTDSGLAKVKDVEVTHFQV